MEATPEYLASIPEGDSESVRPVQYCHAVDRRNECCVVVVLEGPRRGETVQIPTRSLSFPSVLRPTYESQDAWMLP